MYGGSGAWPAGSPFRRTRQRPSPRCSSSSTGAEAAPRLQSPRRPRERLPLPIADLLEQQHLAARLLDRDPRRDDPGVVDDDKRVADLPCKVGESAVSGDAGRALVDQQPRLVAPQRRMLGDQLGREVVLQLG